MIAEGVIYKYTSPSSKSYIGKTIHEDKRGLLHKNAAKRGEKGLFYNALRKYGIEKMSYEILIRFKCDVSSIDTYLNLMEVFFIKKYNTKNNGYNITHGGEGVSGMTLSDEAKRRIGEANSGINNWNYKNGENNPMYGRRGELCPHYGKRGDKNKLSKRLLDLTTGIIYVNSGEASEKLGVSRNRFSDWVLGRGRRKWEFVYIEKDVVPTEDDINALRNVMNMKKQNSEVQAFSNRSISKFKTIQCVYTGEVFNGLQDLSDKMKQPITTVKHWVKGKGSRKNDFKYIEV